MKALTRQAEEHLNFSQRPEVIQMKSSVTAGFGFLTLAAMAITLPLEAQTTIDNFESHDWDYWFGTVANPPANAFQPAEGSAVEYSTAVSQSGQSLLIKETWRRAGACVDCGISAVRAVRSNTLVQIPVGSVTGDVTFDVYLDGANFGANDDGGGMPVSVPGMKVELGTTAGNASSAEEAMTYQGWKTYTVAQGDISGDVNELRFIFVMDFPFGSAQSDGDWSIYVDDMRINGVLVDGFERTPVYGSEVEASGVGFEQPPDPALADPFSATDNGIGSSMVPTLAGGPTANEGSFAYVLNWNTETDGTVGITANHSNDVRDVSAAGSISVDVYVPSPQSIPTFSLNLADSSGGTESFAGTAVSSTDAWETVIFNLAGLSTVDPGDIQLINVTATSAGTDGTLYFDNMVAAGSVVSEVRDWQAYE